MIVPKFEATFQNQKPRVFISSFPKTNLISEWSQSNVPAVSSGVSSAFFKFNLLKKKPSMFLQNPTLFQATRQNILSMTILTRQNIMSISWYVLAHCFFRVVESFPLFLGSLIVNYGITIYFWIFPIIRFVALQFFYLVFWLYFLPVFKKGTKI
jgi:hypothetical protein